MADAADEANELSERLLVEALAEQRQAARQRAMRPAAEWCVDCGIEIPAERRRAVSGVRRCVRCAGRVERTRRGRW